MSQALADVQSVDVGSAGARHPDVAERGRRGIGTAPTGMVAITLFVAGSMRETVSSPRFGTNTVPSSATAAFSGWAPTWIVATTFARRGSIRDTVLESGSTPRLRSV